jgi:glycine cleavage system H protein
MKRYTKDHEWVKKDAEQTKVGITKYAIESLGDIVFVELPDIGSSVKKGDAVATIESVKAASDIYSPVDGEIVAVNDVLDSAPETINEKGEETWIFAIKPTNADEIDLLMSEEEYENSK